MYFFWLIERRMRPIRKIFQSLLLFGRMNLGRISAKFISAVDRAGDKKTKPKTHPTRSHLTNISPFGLGFGLNFPPKNHFHFSIPNKHINQPKPNLCQNHPSHLKSQRVMPWNNFNPKYVLGGLGGALFLVLALLGSPYISLLLLRLGFEVPMQASSVFFAAKPKPFFSTPFRVKSQFKTATFGNNPSKTTMAATPKWAQKTVVLPVQKRGCHLITPKLVKEIEQDLSGFKCGLAHFFLQHTSASLTINENYDTDVRDDTETFLNKIVPEGNSAPWKHTLEGPDDMPAHIKSSMFGCTLTVPITDGRLNMGTWQGIWLCEHRDYATPRKVVVTLNGV